MTMLGLDCYTFDNEGSRGSSHLKVSVEEGEQTEVTENSLSG